jgi:hypothetical protein
VKTGTIKRVAFFSANLNIRIAKAIEAPVQHARFWMNCGCQDRTNWTAADDLIRTFRCVRVGEAAMCADVQTRICMSAMLYVTGCADLDRYAAEDKLVQWRATTGLTSF